jgi:hypothetical protein
MSVLAVVLTAFAVAVAASTRAVAAGSGAGTDKPPVLLVENLPASAEAKDFILRTICNDSILVRRPDAAGPCYKLLLPYAGSINGSYTKASLAMSTVMVSKFADLVKDLRFNYGPTGRMDGCIKVLDEAVTRAREALPALGRLSAVADKVVDAKDPDFLLAWDWFIFIDDNFLKCWDGGLKRDMDNLRSTSAADHSEYAASRIFFTMPKPYEELPSPDGSNP